MKYYYMDENSQVYGPLALEEIITKKDAGELPWNVKISEGNGGEWDLLFNVTERTKDKDQAIKNEAVKNEKVKEAAKLSTKSIYAIPRIMADVLLGIAILCLVILPIYFLLNELWRFAIVATVNGLALVVLAFAAKAIFDIADKILER